jgi:hypothetical protein
VQRDVERLSIQLSPPPIALVNKYADSGAAKDSHNAQQGEGGTSCHTEGTNIPNEGIKLMTRTIKLQSLLQSAYVTLNKLVALQLRNTSNCSQPQAFEHRPYRCLLHLALL